MRVHPNRAAKLPCLDGPHLKIKSTKSATGNHSIPYTPNAIFNRRIHRASRLTLSDCGSRKDSAKAVVDSTPGDPSLQGHAAPAVVLPKGDSHPAARPVTTHVMDALTHIALVRQIHRTSLPCSNLSAWPNLAPTCARLFLLERDGHFYHCCSPDRTGLCGIPPRDNRRDKRRCHQQQPCR